MALRTAKAGVQGKWSMGPVVIREGAPVRWCRKWILTVVNEGSQARGATDLELPERGKVWGRLFGVRAFR